MTHKSLLFLFFFFFFEFRFNCINIIKNYLIKFKIDSLHLKVSQSIIIINIIVSLCVRGQTTCPEFLMVSSY